MRFFGMVMFAVAVAQCGSEVAAAPAKVVDMSVAAKQHNFRVVENKIKGNDPLSVAASAYVTQRGRVAMLNLQNSMLVAPFGVPGMGICIIVQRASF